LCSCPSDTPPVLPSFPTRRSSDLPISPISPISSAPPLVAHLPIPPPAVRHRRDPRRALHRRVQSLRGLLLPARRRQSLHRQRRPDRKSTRLNSSHVKISYAVFCLK